MCSNVCCWIIGGIAALLFVCCCCLGIRLGKLHDKCGRCVYYSDKKYAKEDYYRANSEEQQNNTNER